MEKVINPSFTLLIYTMIDKTVNRLPQTVDSEEEITLERTHSFY